MKIEKSELTGKLNKVKSIVPKRAATEETQGVLIKDRCLIANNYEVMAKLNLECEDDDTFIIPVKAFDLINSLPDGEVEIAGTDKEVVIKAKKIRNKYATISPDQFPVQVEDKEEGKSFKIDSEKFLQSVKRVAFAIAVSNTNAMMNTMCLRAKDGKLHYITLDGHMIAWDKVDYEGDYELLIPKNTVDRLLSIGLTGEMTITSTSTSAIFRTEGCEINSRIVTGEFFQVEKMIGMDMPITTAVDRRDMLDALNRARMCSNAENVPVVLDFKGGEVTVSLAVSTADYSETVELAKDVQEDIRIGFNPRLLIDSLKSFDDDTVDLNMANKKSPLLMTCESEYKALVLPVMVKES